MPILDVPVRAGQYPSFVLKEGQLLKSDVKNRAAYSAYPRGTRAFNQDTYTALEYGYEEAVDDTVTLDIARFFDAEVIAAKLAKQAAADKEVSDDTKKATDAGDASQKQITKFESDLASIRAAKDKASRESFELAKQVELAKVAKRNAEFEIQRTTEMVSRRASDSSLTRMPPPPPLPPVVK
jgi:hypothetical protein